MIILFPRRPLGQILRQFSQTPLLGTGAGGRGKVQRGRGGCDPLELEIEIRERLLNATGLNSIMSDHEGSPDSPPPVANRPKRDQLAEVEEEERREREEKLKNREPPIVFRYDDKMTSISNYGRK